MDNTLKALDGHSLKAAIAAGAHCLRRYSDIINALNVFPVPDGDTGTNMLLTMQSVNERLRDVETDSLSTVAHEAARGALFGARGNSGVIWSQFMAGLAGGVDGSQSCDPRGLASALATASDASYNAVSKPVEGTMLTVIRGFAESARQHADNGGGDVISLWRDALLGARRSLEETPSLLPVLRDAGVIDSGGQGVVVILDGFLCSFLDQDPADYQVEITGASADGHATLPTISDSFIAHSMEEEYGYCTEFMIEGSGIDLAALRSYLSEKGSSLIVVGDSTLAKVHLHTFEPDEVIAHGATLGATMGVKVDDISQQHEGFTALHRGGGRAPELAVVAVAWGEGFANLFSSLGCHAVVPCGRTMNPSAQELMDAVEATGAQRAVILPNNSNVALAARQAAEISQKEIHVIPSTTLAQGVAALLSYSPDVAPEHALAAMEAGRGDARTAEVTTAHRDTVMDGQEVRSGQVIGLLEGTLIATGDSVEDVTRRCLLSAEPADDAVVTLYWGGDTGEAQAQETASRLQEALSNVEVEAVFGGQPFYHYIISIEE